MIRILTAIVLICTWLPLPGQKLIPGTGALPAGRECHGDTVKASLRMVFTGDIMGHDSQIASALATGAPGYDYTPCFRHLAPYLNGADLVVGNLEVTLAGPPYKGYPRFSSPDGLADALKQAGFDILLTANNHVLDRGTEGLMRTREQLEERGLLHTGAYAHDTIRWQTSPLVVEKKGIRIALLNYTYGTNGLKVPPPVVINRLDTSLIRSDLEKAATAKPDLIVAAVHWGTEYERTENSAQRRLARFLFRHGADVVIGSHPHVVQPIRGSGRGNLVAYSLGNLISNQRSRYRDGGIAFELEVVKGENGARVDAFGYLPVWVYKPVTKNGPLFTLVPAASGTEVHEALRMPGSDRIRMKQFLLDTRARLEGIRELEPYWMEGLTTSHR